MKKLFAVLLLLISSPAWALGPYSSGVWDEQGNGLAAVTVTVYLADTVTMADLYSDNGITPIANPMTTDYLGRYSFWAASGLYDICYSDGGIEPWCDENEQVIDSNQMGSQQFNVTDVAYGAVPNDGLDDTAAFRAAIAACQAATNNGVIYVPAGLYEFSDTLAITESGVTLRGSGYGQEGSTDYGTVFAPLASATAFGPLITIGTTTTDTYGSGIQDISLWGGRDTDAFAYKLTGLVRILNCRECFVDRCRVDLRCSDTDGRIALLVDTSGSHNSTSNRISDSHVQSPYRKVGGVDAWGFGIVFDSTGGWNTANVISNCKLYAGGPDIGTGKIIETRADTGFYMHDTQVDAGYDHGINALALGGFFITNCILDGSGSGDELLTIADTARYCYFQGHINGGPVSSVDSNSNPNVKAWILDTADRSGPSFPAINLQPRTAAPYHVDAGKEIHEGTIYYNSVDKIPYLCTQADTMSAAQWTAIQTAAGSGGFSVDSYGAVADDGSDDYAAIQAAIDACELAGTGGDITFGKGLYRISSGLTVMDSNIRLVGAGKSGEAGYTDGTTIMVQAGVVSNFTMLTFGAADSTIYGGGMQGIHLWSGNTYTLTGGLALVNCIEFTVQDCRVDLRNVGGDGYSAVLIDATGGNSKLNRFLNCSIQGPHYKATLTDAYGYGVTISRSGTGANRANSFDHCWFYGPQTTGSTHLFQTKDSAVGYTFVSNSQFDFTDARGISLAGGDGGDGFINCRVTGTSSGDVHLVVASGAEDCYFVGSMLGSYSDANTGDDAAYVVNTSAIGGPNVRALNLIPRSAAPSPAAEGMIYYDSDTNKLMIYVDDGTPAWETVTHAP